MQEAQQEPPAAPASMPSKQALSAPWNRRRSLMPAPARVQSKAIRARRLRIGLKGREEVSSRVRLAAAGWLIH